jgi:hypothetical protein
VVKVQRWLAILNKKNNLIPYLNGNGNWYDDKEMRRIIFKSMPEKWQEEFTSNGNNDIGTATTAAIVTFMKQQEAKARAKAAAGKAKQVSESHQGSRKTNGNKRPAPTNNGSWKNNKKSKRFQSSDRKKSDGNHNNGDGEICTWCTH